MSLSVFDLFKIGIGPSSSHTVGPMRAALRFAEGLRRDGQLTATRAIKVELYGSLGATGKGHGSDRAVLLGLEGEQPESVDTDSIPARLATIRERGELRLLGEHPIPFDSRAQLAFIRRPLPFHPNGLIFRAFDAAGLQLCSREYYSVGGGFVVDDEADLLVERLGPVQRGIGQPLDHALDRRTVAGTGQPIGDALVIWVIDRGVKDAVDGRRRHAAHAQDEGRLVRGGKDRDRAAVLALLALVIARDQIDPRRLQRLGQFGQQQCLARAGLADHGHHPALALDRRRDFFGHKIDPRIVQSRGDGVPGVGLIGGKAGQGHAALLTTSRSAGKAVQRMRVGFQARSSFAVSITTWVVMVEICGNAPSTSV